MYTSHQPAQERSGCLGRGLFFLASLWVILISLIVQASGWFGDQFAVSQSGSPLPPSTWLWLTWGQGVALALVVLPLALWSRAPRLRAAYRLWALAITLLFAFALARLCPLLDGQTAAFAQTVLALVGAGGLWLLAARLGRLPGRGPRSLAPAIAAGALLFVPWVAFGALGSPLDTLLNALAGCAFGLCAGMLIAFFLLGTPGEGATRDIAFAGFVAGVALLIMASGFGLSGSQLLLMTALPPLGFALVALNRLATTPAASWPTLAVLVGAAAAGPLLFFDPAELQLILEGPGGGEIPTWAARAALLAFLLAWLLSISLTIFRRRLAGPPRPAPMRYLAVAALIALAALYVGEGRPGFYGDKLFVILRDQPDVSAAANIAERTERVSYVYGNLTRRSAETQTDLRATLDRLHIPYQPYYLVNALEVDGGALVRAYLASRPEVDRVLANPTLRPLPAPLPVASGTSPAPLAPTWNITATGAERVWQELGVTGKGIVVGQSDSGVQGDHPALRDGYRGRDGQNNYNWLDPWGHSSAPRDVGGHGTHTLGSILGDGGIGQAPDAQWFACVNLERNLGNPALYLDCLQFMLAPYPQGGDAFKDGDPTRAAHVLNNSWGCPPLEGCEPGTLQTATRALRAAGIFVVASAGNSGPSCGSVGDPIALYDDVFTVGAIDQKGNVADFSSRGPVTVDGSNRVKPDIVAPGVDVLSSFPNSTYQIASGTSMAGPQVVGIVALMWSANPKLIGNIERTERILIEKAQPYTGTRSEGCFAGGTPNYAYGYGVVDAYAAVQAALAER